MCIRDRFITHDLDEALKIGDRIAILKDGIMDQEGLPVDILLSPKTEYVSNFVEDVNRSRVLKAKHIMEKANGSDLSKGMPVDENDFIESFIDRVVAEKPDLIVVCLLYTSPSPRDGLLSRMPSSA